MWTRRRYETLDTQSRRVYRVTVENTRQTAGELLGTGVRSTECGLDPLMDSQPQPFKGSWVARYRKLRPIQDTT